MSKEGGGQKMSGAEAFLGRGANTSPHLKCSPDQYIEYISQTLNLQTSFMITLNYTLKLSVIKNYTYLIKLYT